MPYKSLLEFLSKKYIHYIINGECWECISHKPNNSGYPVTHTGLIHRKVYAFLNGKIPPNKLVCHSCDNRICINPSHLWLGTHEDNQNDKISKGRQSRLFGENNGRSKLKEHQVLNIIKDNRNIKDIAKEHGVSFQLISRIKRKEVWYAI